MRRFRIVHGLAQRLWIIPSIGVVAGIVLSLVTVRSLLGVVCE